MKVLLIIPHVPQDVIYGKLSGEIGSLMPSLGIFYMASYLKKINKHSVDILDANVLKLDSAAILGRVSKSQYDCVGFTATTLGFSYAADAARSLRHHLPGLTLLIGGPHAQADADGILLKQAGLFDYVCYGEGEIALESLLDHLDGAAGRDALRGWKYLDNGTVVTTPPAHIPDDLDMFGHPADVLHPEWVPLYHEKILAYKRLPMFSIMSSRGCPFQCTFCTTPRKFKQMYQQRVRFHSIPWIIEELRLLAERFNIREINFWDDTFNVKRERVLEFCRAKIDSKLDVIWSCNFEANIADIDMMKAMKNADCWSIMVGGESGSDRVLSYIKKGVTVKQLRQVGKWANEVGLVSRVSFIIGLPTDTKETIQETIDFVKDQDFHFPYFQLYVPLPGTEMYEDLPRHGTFVKKDASVISASQVNYLPHGLSETFLLEAYRRAFREAYLRWKMIKNHIQFIRSLSDLRRYWQGLRSLWKM